MAQDVSELKIDQESGKFPFTRGPYATMYTHRPWTIRQVTEHVYIARNNIFSMRGSVPSRRATRFIKRFCQPGNRASASLSICQLIADTIPITRELVGMLAWLVWPLTLSRT